MTFQSFAQTNLESDISCVIKEVSYHPVSINLNYLTDGEYLNTETVTEIPLKKMGVKFLRYPGGEKSDNYFWSVPPFQGVDPHFALQGNCTWPNSDSKWTSNSLQPKEYTLDFDEYIELCQKIQAEPFIVVPGDPQRFNDPGCLDYPSLAEVANVAKEWVRYANVTRDLGIKYWMIGNESWNSAAYDNGISPGQYRNDFKVIASAMKAIDSTIKIVANTKPGNYAKLLLQDPIARDLIDYMGISNYSIYNWTGGYNNFLNQNPSFVFNVNGVLDDIDQYAPDSDIEVIVTEFNAIDWSSNGWSNIDNDLGHALVVFQIMGDHLELRRLQNSFYWNTRWVNESIGMYNAIDFAGNLNATGKAMSIWGNFLLDKMVSSSETNNIRTYTTKSDDQLEVNVLLLNKTHSIKPVNFTINQFLDTLMGNSDIKIYEFSGSSILDKDPSFEQIVKPYTLNANEISLDLPPTSVTVISIKATQPTALANLCPNNLILENPGFEGSDFSGWLTSGQTDLNTDAYSGGSAARMQGLGSFVEQKFAVESGDSCHVHAFLKRIDATTTGTIRIRFFNNEDKILTEKMIPFNLSNHYEAYDFFAVAPEQSKNVEIRFFNNYSQGTMFLDNVCFMIENQSSGTTSLEEPDKEQIAVFPNPTNGKFTIQFGEKHTYQKIAVFDLNGALITRVELTEGIPEWEMDLSNLATGLYVLHVFSEDNKAVKLIRKM